MNIEDIRRIVDRMLIDEFEIEPAEIHPEAHLRDDLDLDSLDAVDMIVYFEKKYGIKIEPESAQKIRTIGDIYGFIQEMTRGRDL
ncbi:MAG: acyl carrier protein [Deltaproteobacteria bacterium]|nr:acyl carrier protein [Deltaproteobacteria bacterium]